MSEIAPFPPSQDNITFARYPHVLYCLIRWQCSFIIEVLGELNVEFTCDGYGEYTFKYVHDFHTFVYLFLKCDLLIFPDLITDNIFQIPQCDCIEKKL